MTGDPVTCDLGDDVNEVMGKMSERRIAKVPVLHNDKLVGIVSVGDVIKVLYEQVSSENQHLMTYIHGPVDEPPLGDSERAFPDLIETTRSGFGPSGGP